MFRIVVLSLVCETVKQYVLDSACRLKPGEAAGKSAFLRALCVLCVLRVSLFLAGSGSLGAPDGSTLSCFVEPDIGAAAAGNNITINFSAWPDSRK